MSDRRNSPVYRSNSVPEIAGTDEDMDDVYTNTTGGPTISASSVPVAFNAPFAVDVDVQVIHQVRADVESQFTSHNTWHPHEYFITAEVDAEWSVDESEVV